MTVRGLVCGLSVVLAAGCAGGGPNGSLARMHERLDRAEQSRRASGCPVLAQQGWGTGTSFDHRSSPTLRCAKDGAHAHGVAAPTGASSSARAFRLASYSAEDDALDASARLFALAEADVGESAGIASRRERLGPLPGLWETIKRDVKHMPDELWHDTKKVYTSAPNLLILGATYGGALALQETGPDSTVEDRLRGHDIFSDGVNNTLGAAGNPGTHFALAGAWYLIGQQAQDEKTYEVGKTLFSALVINGLSTMLGQAASWDRAPNGEWGTFPSGHTSSTFCFASVMHEAYGPLAGFPLYGLGTLVAIERLDDDEHYFSDVVMGAVLGLVVGHTVAGEHELEVFGGTIVPYADPNTGSTGVAWVTHFE